MQALSEGGDLPHEVRDIDEFPDNEHLYESDSDEYLSDYEDEEDLFTYFSLLKMKCIERIGDNFVTEYDGKSAAVLFQKFKHCVPYVVRVLRHLEDMRNVQKCYSWRYLSPGIHNDYKNAIIVSAHSGEPVGPEEAKYYIRLVIKRVLSVQKRGVIHLNIGEDTVVCNDGNVTLTGFDHALFIDEIVDDNVEKAKAEEARMVGLLLATWLYPDEEIDPDIPREIYEKSRKDDRVHLKDGFSLMRALLRTDPDRRISLENALDHKWFEKDR